MGSPGWTSTALAVALCSALTASCASSSIGEQDPQQDTAPVRRERAVVVRIVDGDTLWLRGDGRGLISADHTKVRLLEIDTPETGPGQPVECYAQEAAQDLAALAPVGSDVRVLRDRDLMDPYGRMLLYVWNDDGEFVNLELVRSGAAVAVLYEPNDLYIDQMRSAERAARDAGRGRWGAC